MSSLNESDKSAHLELLPVELKCEILTRIPDMKALRAFLSASPRYFQVYRTSRELVLSHVAWNHITPAVVPIALDALERRDKRKNGIHCTKQLTSQRTLKGALEIPLKAWEVLIRFHQIVDAFISNFTSSRLVTVENVIHPQTQTSSSHEFPGRHFNLSQLEYARLARAFYHLELYAYFIYPGDSQVLQTTTWRQLKSFLESLQSWELEELLCVRSYMIERLIDFLNKFEDDFLKAYLKDKPCIIWPSRGNGLELNWRAHLFVHGDNLQSEWMESCLVRGLEYLSAILSTDKLPAKFNALQHVALEYQWMSTVLNQIKPYSEMEVMAKMKESSEIGFYDNIEQPNEAWFWAVKYGVLPRICSRTEPLIKPIQDGCDTNDCERWGYVIWDHARLERLGILTKSPSDISAIIGTDWVIKKTPKSLEERTWEYEETGPHAGLQSHTTRPTTVFDWEHMWFA